MADPLPDVTRLMAQAQAGSVEAQCKLALRYELGDELPQDPQQALHWYGLAAAQGDLFAKMRIADMRRKMARQNAGGLYAMDGIVRDFYPPARGAAGAGGAAQAIVEPAVSEAPFDLEAELARWVGMEEVKAFFRRFAKQEVAANKRAAAGHSVERSAMPHLVIAGSPGSGKTSVARLAARFFHHLGYLRRGQLIETSKAGLVSEYTSQTARKTTELFQSALGGMLVIDDAQTFLSASANQANAHDREALETLETLLERHAGETAVVLTGSRKELEQLLRQYPGLRARFTTVLSLPDYTADQLWMIFERMMTARGFRISASGARAAQAALRARNRAGEAERANAHLCAALLDEAIMRQSVRIVDTDATDAALITLEADDFADEARDIVGFDLEARLSAVIGLESIKDFLRGLYAQLRLETARRETGLDTGRGQTLHLVFRGNPGTGKTMMARILAELLQAMGVLRMGQLVETDRGGLVAGYVGQTAEKTRDKIREALNGVLFIDEAYALANDAGSAQGFGREAIDTLVKDMDDNRDRLVVVLAGYRDEMDAFLASNPGLRSRFPTVLTFADYSLDELMAIAESFFREKKYQLTADARITMRDHLAAAMVHPHFGNGRYARNLYEKALRNQALRLLPDTDLTERELTTICAADIPATL